MSQETFSVVKGYGVYLAFMAFLVILSLQQGCGGSMTPVQPPVLQKARISGQVEVDVEWYGMDITVDCGANAQRGDETVDGAEAECCIAVGIWVDCWDVSSGRLVVE